MEINYYNQPKDVRLGELLCEKLEQDFDKAYIFSGFVKDSGIYYLMPALEKSNIDEIHIAIGVDNKNTSKDMLARLINLGIHLNVFVNNDNEKIETRMYAFLNKKGNSYIYLSASKLSEGGLVENECLVTEIVYDKEENGEVERLVKKVISESKFEKASEEYVTNLAANGEIVARISERRIPRISEMYAKEEVEIGAREYDESIGSSAPVQEYEDIDISVELPMDGKVQVRNSLGEEVEQVIKKVTKKSKEALDSAEEKVSAKILPKEKEIDYEHMNTFIFMIQSADRTGIKIAASIAKNLLKFIDYPENFHVADVKGKFVEIAKVTFEIFDNTTEAVSIDSNAMLIKREKELSLDSTVLKELNLQKEDLIRMMKEKKGKYRLEIIRSDTDEHKVWTNYCVLTVKGSARKYGII